MSDEVLVARALLSRVAEPANIPVWALVRRVGPVAAIDAIRTGTADGDVLAATQRIVDADPLADLDAAQRHGLRLVVPESDEWPHFALAALEASGLRRLARYRAGERAHAPSGEPIPPLALWVRGDIELATLGVNSAALVGARAATAYGERIAAEFAFGLSGRGCEIVSGGAFGIDAAAHRAALAGGGVTVLVSAGGLDRAYPAAHATLFDSVGHSGLLVSESPPGTAPRRHRFLTRNRLIAAFASGCVVVEASARSGAMNTAGHALTLGRAVLAVPGPITSAMSVGCHQLLARHPDRVSLATSVSDVAAMLGGATAGPDTDDRPGGGAATQASDGTAAGAAVTADAATTAATGACTGAAEQQRRRQLLDSVDATAQRVFDALPARAGLGAEFLARAAGVSPAEMRRAVPALELVGLIERVDGEIRIRRSDTAAARRNRMP